MNHTHRRERRNRYKEISDAAARRWLMRHGVCGLSVNGSAMNTEVLSLCNPCARSPRGARPGLLSTPGVPDASYVETAFNGGKCGGNWNPNPPRAPRPREVSLS